jgi:hypothetical protein
VFSVCGLQSIPGPPVVGVRASLPLIQPRDRVHNLSTMAQAFYVGLAHCASNVAALLQQAVYGIAFSISLLCPLPTKIQQLPLQGLGCIYSALDACPPGVAGSARLESLQINHFLFISFVRFSYTYDVKDRIEFLGIAEAHCFARSPAAWTNIGASSISQSLRGSTPMKQMSAQQRGTAL